MTVTGEVPRTVRSGSIRHCSAITARADMIAVSGHTDINLFDMTSGSFIRSFGEEGEAEGQLYGVSGLRFTPDGTHILVAESDNRRLSLFTLTGAFVRCIGVGTLGEASDVEFASNGDIIVADRSNHRICVFSPDGSELIRTFGSEGDGDGEFEHPNRLGVHGDQLYVMDESLSESDLGYAGRVQVFT